VLADVVQHSIRDKRRHFYVIDAHAVASDVGMGGRIDTLMQACFFAISGILPQEEAIAQIKKSIKKTYGKRGEAVVERNFRAVDETLTHLFEVNVPVGLAVGATSESNGSALPRRTPIALPVLTRRPPVAAE